MNLKKCLLEHMDLEYLMTELRFNIAAARAEKTELLMLELITEEERSRRRRYTSVLFRLRQLKREGVIQFFATEDDFADNTTEADYLLNKYPELAEVAGIAGAREHRIVIIRV